MTLHSTAGVGVNGINRINSQNKTEVEQARQIAKSLGYFTAARYLFKRNWSFEMATFILLGV